MNFKIKIKLLLFNKNNKGETLEEIYLIDKRWIKNWKQHVGYYVLKEFYIKNKNKGELKKRWLRLDRTHN